MLKVIGECYENIFGDARKSRKCGGSGSMWMVGSGVSNKSKEGSTEGTFKKGVW
mgnify:CR=1 FL=1